MKVILVFVVGVLLSALLIVSPAQAADEIVVVDTAACITIQEGGTNGWTEQFDPACQTVERDGATYSYVDRTLEWSDSSRCDVGVADYNQGFVTDPETGLSMFPFLWTYYVERDCPEQFFTSLGTGNRLYCWQTDVPPLPSNGAAPNYILVQLNGMTPFIFTARMDDNCRPVFDRRSESGDVIPRRCEIVVARYEVEYDVYFTDTHTCIYYTAGNANIGYRFTGGRALYASPPADGGPVVFYAGEDASPLAEIERFTVTPADYQRHRPTVNLRYELVTPAPTTTATSAPPVTTTGVATTTTTTSTPAPLGPVTEEEFTLSPQFAAVANRADLTGDHANILRLYWAAFDREPDVGGAEWWINAFNTGAWPSLVRIGEFFVVSPEFVDTYGALTNAAFVEALYLNILDRPSDNGGRAFWLDDLNDGTRTRGRVLADFSFSQEFRDARPLPSDNR